MNSLTTVITGTIANYLVTKDLQDIVMYSMIAYSSNFISAALNTECRSLAQHILRLIHMIFDHFITSRTIVFPLSLHKMSLIVFLLNLYNTRSFIPPQSIPFSQSSMDYSHWNYNISCCRKAIIGMRVAEVSCMAIATILIIMFIIALIKTKVLHSNLRALLIATSLTDFAIIHIRIYDLLHTKGLIIDHPLVHLIKRTGWMFNCFLLLLILIERYYAIRHNNTYDETSMKCPFCIISLISAMFVISFSLSILTETGIISRSFFIFSLLILSVVTFVLYILFLTISSSFTKRLDANRLELNQFNYVSGRFQAVESRRSHHMLRYYIPFQVGTLLAIIATSVGLRIFVVPTHPTYFLLIQQYTYFLFVPRAIISTIIVILLHPSLRKTVRQMMILRRCTGIVELHSQVTKADQIRVKSLSGKQLNFEADHERDIYFEGYAELWQLK